MTCSPRLSVALRSSHLSACITQDESLTVISSAFYFGKGDKAETRNAPTITAGAFHYLSGKDHHYLVAKTSSVIQINGNGPFDVIYINGDDDPQKSKM